MRGKEAFSVAWKSEGLMDGESGNDEGDELARVKWRVKVKEIDYKSGEVDSVPTNSRALPPDTKLRLA